MFSFMRKRPEEVGIPSGAIAAYIRAIEERRLCLHSLLIIRRGALVFEGQWAPMTSIEKHRLYSSSKSFVSMAIGLLVGDGKLQLSDRVVDFFPEYDQSGMHHWMKDTTIRDLLCMADCHDDTTYNMNKPEPDMDWVRTWFETPPTHKSGTVFQYNTACTLMLCVIVERVAGKNFEDLLRERVFEPMGMREDITCVKSPCGHSWGGSGILAGAMDLAKMAYLVMHGGCVDGKQLLPADYVREATANQIDNAIDADNVEYMEGYGYQIWRLRHNGFGFLGMGSQQAFCFPDEDLLIAVTGDTQAMADARTMELMHLWNTVFREMQDQPLLPNDAAWKNLEALRKSLKLRCVDGAHDSPMTRQLSGARYAFEPNAMGLKEMEFRFTPGGGLVTYVNDTGWHSISFGYGFNVEQQFNETSFYAEHIGFPADRDFRAFASAAWRRENVLHITLYIADVCCGTMQWTCTFTGDTVTLEGRRNAEWFFTKYQGFATGECINPLEK